MMLQAIRASRPLQLAGLLAGLIVFIAGSAISLRELNVGRLNLQWQVVVPLLLTIPVTMHLSIRRFEALASSVDVPATYRTAASVVVWGGIANLLPLPGAFMVRFSFLADRVGARRSGLINLSSLFAWFLAAALIAAALCFPEHRDWTVGLLALSAAFGAACWKCAQMARAVSGGVLRVLYIQLLLTGLNVIRLLIIALLLNMWLPPAAASLMALTGVAAAATGIFPAGLGLTESLAALVGWALELQAALGFGVAAINRVCGWLGLALYIPWIARPGGASGEEQP